MAENPLIGGTNLPFQVKTGKGAGLFDISRLKLIALSAEIDRNKLPLDTQINIAQKRVGKEGGRGVEFWQAMAQLARGQIFKQAEDRKLKTPGGTLLGQRAGAQGRQRETPPGTARSKLLRSRPETRVA